MHANYSLKIGITHLLLTNSVNISVKLVFLNDKKQNGRQTGIFEKENLETYHLAN